MDRRRVGDRKGKTQLCEMRRRRAGTVQILPLLSFCFVAAEGTNRGQETTSPQGHEKC